LCTNTSSQITDSEQFKTLSAELEAAVREKENALRETENALRETGIVVARLEALQDKLNAAEEKAKATNGSDSFIEVGIYFLKLLFTSSRCVFFVSDTFLSVVVTRHIAEFQFFICGERRAVLALVHAIFWLVYFFSIFI
jgi:hypothetical protein